MNVSLKIRVRVIKRYWYTLYAVFLFICLIDAAEFELIGPIPSGINVEFLQKEYGRIKRKVCPQCPDKYQRITIIYSDNSNRIRGIRLPEWGGGGAKGTDTILVLLNSVTFLQQFDYCRVTLHEMVHIVLNRCYGNLRIPRWIHEGLAMELSGEISMNEHVIISRALFFNTLLPLDSIERVNLFDADGAHLAYSQSHIAVQFLIDTYGYGLIPELLEASRKHRLFSNACFEVLGLSLKEMEQLIKEYIRSKYKYMFLLGDSYVWWMIILILAIISFVITRIKNNRKMRLLDENCSKQDLLKGDEKPDVM